jgi:GntR family uxuAB operon transcriptional repressor
MTLRKLPSSQEAAEQRPYRVVADRIQAVIRDQRIKPGARLPSERDFAAQLSVSRASLREALIALELGGIIEVRGGSGIYVSDGPEPGINLPEACAGPFEVLSARRLIEAEIAAIAARVATESAVDAIARAVDEMERHHASQSHHEHADRNFHLAIARATGNSALVGVMQYLWDQRGRLWHKFREHFQTEELSEDSLLDHRLILEAIAARDPAAARRAMRTHLERVTRTLSRG